MSNELQTFLSLALAAGVGLLMGLERERALREKAEAQDVAVQDLAFGARTFALISLSGCVSALLVSVAGVWLVVISGVALVCFLLMNYYNQIRKEQDQGLTTEFAALVTFLLGVMLGATSVAEIETRGWYAAVGALLVTVLLSAKHPIHVFARGLSKEDVESTLKFMVVALILLPLLPNRAFGPFDVFNPFEIGLLVALIAGIGFGGYVAMRVFGAGRGLGITGLLGGLASSTAVTLAMASRAKETRGLSSACANAIVLASTMMFARVLVELALVNRALFLRSLIPVTSMGIAMATLGIVQYRRSTRAPKTEDEEFQISNPLSLGSALKFGLLFVAVLFGAKAAREFFGDSGLFVASIVAGAADVDAITLSLAKLSHNNVELSNAAIGVILASLSNTMVKAGIAAVIGGRALAKHVGFAMLPAIVVGAISIVVLAL